MSLKELFTGNRHYDNAYEGCPKNSRTAVIVVRVIDRKTFIIYHLKGRSVSIEKTTEKNV
jgi:hypothetical protein